MIYYIIKYNILQYFSKKPQPISGYFNLLNNIINNILKEAISNKNYFIIIGRLKNPILNIYYYHFILYS